MPVSAPLKDHIIHSLKHYSLSSAILHTKSWICLQSEPFASKRSHKENLFHQSIKMNLRKVYYSVFPSQERWNALMNKYSLIK